jgi:hypothetical protein
MPIWHLKLPLPRPQITFAKPVTVRLYPRRQRAANPMKKRAHIIPSDSVESPILTLRGQKLILDSDLAEIYAVDTAALNRAVKRNVHRFPSDFMFRLTREEFVNLRCQIGISSSRYGGRRFLPYAFTENGAVMAANVLNSPQAVRMSVHVVRAFIQMRTLLSSSQELAAELKKLEAKLTDRLDLHESAIVDVLRRIMQLLDPPPAPPEPEKSMGFHATMRRPVRKPASISQD